MALQASCPYCQTQHHLDDRCAGKTIHCKQCRQGFSVGGGPANQGQKWRLIFGLSIAGGLLLIASMILVVFLLIPRDVDQKLKDLQAADRQTREQAVVWLAQADPQDSDRVHVTGTLEPLLFEGDVHRALDPDLLVRAYLPWADKDNVPAMIRMVENPTLPAWGPRQTGLVIDALGKLGDARAMDVIAGRLADPLLHDQAVNALKVMGPQAEKAVLAYLFDQDPDTRSRASQLLADYGTRPQSDRC